MATQLQDLPRITPIETRRGLLEWSPYADLHPPHLDGYFASKRGEFRLIALPNGRTRLEGSTWYELRMAPAAYWSIFATAIVERIHMRVLRHIKSVAEQSPRTPAP